MSAGFMLHNGGELPGQFSSLMANTQACQDHAQACHNAYTGLLDVSTGRAPSAAGEFGNHVYSTQTSLQETAANVTMAAQSHHGEVNDIDASFASIVG